MFNFVGESCPVCGGEFAEKDDIVVCPFCGAPHHRACYAAENKCSFSELHDKGYEWKSEKSEDADSGKEHDAQDASQCRCKNCGAENTPGRLYCISCGHALFDSSAHPNMGFPGQPYFGGAGRPISGAYAFGDGAPTISESELVDDVPVGDIRKFIGGACDYYIPQFVRFARTCRKVSLNFAAFFAHGIWFISRKMYLIGGAVLAVMLGLNMFQAHFVYQAYLQSGAEVLSELEIWQSDPKTLYISAFCNILQYAIMALSGLYGNRLYMSHCVKKIKQINSEANTADEFNAALSSNGGIASVPMLICGILFVAVNFAFSTQLIAF